MTRYVLQMNYQGNGFETLLSISPASKAGHWIYTQKRHGIVVSQQEYGYNPFLETPEKIVEWVLEKFPWLESEKWWVHVQDELHSTTNLVNYNPDDEDENEEEDVDD